MFSHEVMATLLGTGVMLAIQLAALLRSIAEMKKDILFLADQVGDLKRRVEKVEFAQHEQAFVQRQIADIVERLRAVEHDSLHPRDDSQFAK